MKWNLDCFLPLSVEKSIRSLADRISQLDFLNPAVFFKDLEACDLELRELTALGHCLQAQNVQDEKASPLIAIASQLDADYQSVLHKFDEWLHHFDEVAFTQLIQSPHGSPIAFFLKERRALVREKLSAAMEGLISTLAIDGLHGWNQMYSECVGRLKLDGLSMGQAENRLGSPDRDVRQVTFRDLGKIWKEQESIFAQVLNHLSGFRLKIYEKRGWSDFLKEPLIENRMTHQTLQVMWDCVEKHKAPFVHFLGLKANLLNVKKLSWADVEAPFLPGDGDKIAYSDACALIVEQFGSFSPNMAAFADKAFKDQWVEAEDRPNKAAGGFCVAFPKSKESRIFMTYSGTASNVATLAHELGHAYHNHMVEKAPSPYQNYKMNIAETASTFAEMLVIDSLLKKASSKQEKLALLSNKIQRSVVFLMNIHARFLFECALYERRKMGFVSASELSALMLDAQKKAFKDQLDEYHPHFWVSKMHFYISELPFYNFPYTFGYLFSLGLYAKAQAIGSAFADQYDALLRDSGQMSIEDLAEKHLKVDLTKKEFWDSALKVAIADVEAFLELGIVKQ